MPEKRDLMRLDAGETIYFKRELEYVKSKTYDVKYRQLKALSLIPISSEANTGATEITFRRYRGVGLAKIIADYAHDFPRVDVFGEEQTAKVKGIGVSYGYSIPEIRASQYAGKKLDQRRAEVARRAMDEKINALALKGDAQHNLQGFLNYPGITKCTLATDGTGSSAAWSKKTPDQIVRDVTHIVDTIMVPTYGREIPDTLLLPLTQYNHIANTRMGDGSDVTILQYILKTSPVLKTIDWLLELAGAGEGGADRAMAYTRDEQHITLEIPQAFEQFEAQQRGMEFEIPCHETTAGVIIYYPQAVAYADGI